jgi:hypothetical protein
MSKPATLPAKHPGGRPPTKPSVDDPKAIERLCDYLVGGMGMDAACRLPDCPSDTAVYRKMAKDQEFAGVIARAREAQQHAIIDQTVGLADKATAENWQVVRLQIWARQWRAAKLAPKVYGEKTHHDVESQIVHMTPEERDARIAFLLARQKAREAPVIEGRAEASGSDK